MAFVAFQAVFAIITVALISGAIADRAKFGTWLIFAGIWATVVYFPVAHWVFDFTLTTRRRRVTTSAAGSPTTSQALDFAGGTAVHINAGAAGLALALVLGKRIGWRKDPMRPHNLPLVMLGAGLLWFGWFGFNAGSAVSAANTTPPWPGSTPWSRPPPPSLGWLLTEKLRDGHATSLGAASGVVAGLVAITPACRSVTPIGAIIIGAVAGVLCALAVGLKYKLGYDDSLDVVGVHLVGGLWGTIAIGFLATAAAPAGVDGLFYGGGVDQLWRQAVGRVRRPGLLLRPHLRHRAVIAEDHRLPDHRGGRGRGHRRHRARRDRLRLSARWRRSARRRLRRLTAADRGGRTPTR